MWIMVTRSVLKRIGLQWYEWVFLGTLLILAVAFYMTYQRLGTVSDQLFTTEIELDSIQREYSLGVASREIDDRYTGIMLEEINKLRNEQRRRSSSFFNDYLLIPPTVESASIDEVEIEPNPTQESVSAIEPEPEVVYVERQVTRVDNPQRVHFIAERLWEQYCSAVPDAADCTP